MAGIDDLIGTISQIKQSAEELTTMVAAASQSLASQSASIAALSGSRSRSGQEAATQVRMASAGLGNASASLLTLSSECNTFVRDLEK
jgi:hypothetical protein